MHTNKNNHLSAGNDAYINCLCTQATTMDTHCWHGGPSLEASHILNDDALTSVQSAHQKTET